MCKITRTTTSKRAILVLSDINELDMSEKKSTISAVFHHPPSRIAHLAIEPGSSLRGEVKVLRQLSKELGVLKVDSNHTSGSHKSAEHVLLKLVHKSMQRFCRWKIIGDEFIFHSSVHSYVELPEDIFRVFADT